MGLRAKFFDLFLHLSTKKPLFLLPLLNSACLVEENMNVVWEILPSSSERSMEIIFVQPGFWGQKRGVGKVPSLSVEQNSALIRLLDSSEINRVAFF